MRFRREIFDRVRSVAGHFPALVLTGCRQAGKTTLLREVFPHHHYVSLDLPSEAEQAETAPEAFLARHPAPLIVDEVQYAPGLFRHLKVAIDADRHAMGRYILTGSQKFTLMRGVSESLAGRCGWLELENLSAAELRQSLLFSRATAHVNVLLSRGTFPALWRDPDLPSYEFYSSYVATYLERDVRQVLNITSLRDFERFLRVCATYSGQIVNKSEIARSLAISAKTVNEWLGVLEASNQIVLLEPYFANVGKRVTKSPKLYFCDTGLLAFFLGIEPSGLGQSPFVGALWETFVFAELRKALSVHAPSRQVYFYRDQQGLEADFVIMAGHRATLIECKWTELPSARDAKGLHQIAKHFAAAKPYALDATQRLVVARPANAYPLDRIAQAVHAFDLPEVLGVGEQRFA